ncbi:hypothetical protein M885DRAFT_549244 [Pelagophyceae sp. CCMP2097]|nr:hypothetical protein M885DRAFT_549244 [Pelagophyceae sp. CCMP2097]
MRWEEDVFEAKPTHLRFYLEKRKTDQNYAGQWIDIPFVAPSASSFGLSAYTLALAMRERAHGVGTVLRRIYFRSGEHIAPPFIVEGRGTVEMPVGTPMYMARQNVAARLRRRLVSDCGLSVEEARLFSGHSPRAGGATEMVRQKVPEHAIKSLAGVVGADWIRTYDRLDLGRRLDAVAALGF